MKTNTKKMKKREVKCLLIMVLFCNAILFNSCENNNYEIQLPKKVDCSLNIVEQNLFGEIENGSSLIYEFELRNNEEYVKVESSIEIINYTLFFHTNTKNQNG